ncbi:hypothetical protein OG976_11675 [Mycobacterium sp. NBC_00419]|uniref:hypothetical protein n=1 Tax=Mycobacterium sp. NBC_00419 TaxID=2975989 RepID=UPI002E1B1A88
MGRFTTTAVHLTVWLIGGVLYFLFVLPRWWELMGDTSHTLGTVLRIVTGLLFAVAALPVLLTLQRTREPALGTPALALRLRLWSLILHLVAAALIVSTAIAEIWVSLQTAGPWLFGVYGAAAAVAVLALAAFYLSFVAEQAPKPPKEKKPKRKRGKQAEAEAEAEEAEEAETTEPEADAAEETEAEEPEEAEAEEAEATEPEAEAEAPEAEPESGALLNKRPTGKTKHRLRRSSRGTIAPED